MIMTKCKYCKKRIKKGMFICDTCVLETRKDARDFTHYLSIIMA